MGRRGRVGVLAGCLAAAACLVGMLGWPAAASAQPPPYSIVGPMLQVDRSSVPLCGTIAFNGDGYQPGENVTLTLNGAPSVQPLTTQTDANGSFSTILTVPAGTAPGTYTVITNGAAGGSTTADITVDKSGCGKSSILTHATLIPGEGTLVSGTGCPPQSVVNFVIAGRQVAQTTANKQGSFSTSLTPGNNVQPGQFQVTASCGASSFSELLAVVSQSGVKSPSAGAAVFGVFVLLGVLLLVGLLPRSSRRRTRRPTASDIMGGPGAP